MAKVSSITEPYFSHDIAARGDKATQKLIKDMGYEGYGLFWAIVEFMHRNEFLVGEEWLIVNDEYSEKIKMIMNNFELFSIQEGQYISKRIIRNIEQQEEKSKKAKIAVEVRWLVSAFNKEYEKVFGNKPCLSDEEIEKLKKYDKSIKNLKQLLPDIIFSLKKLDFKTDTTFKPCANWLLAKNNLARMVNGEFGKLKHPKEGKENISNKEEETKAGFKLDSSLDSDFYSYDDYRNAKNIIKLEAQKIYTENLSEGKEGAIKRAIEFCKSKRGQN